MELPKRARGDEYTKPGAYPELRRTIRKTVTGLDIPTVIAYAFDKRTKLLPYMFNIERLSPAGVRSVAAALHDSGLTHSRIVLQQWTPNFRPSRARLDGQPLEMLLVSAMQIHAEQAYALIADACAPAAGGGTRPLILAGGPKVIYEPWDMFGLDGNPAVGADIACTGEEFVLMELIETLLEYRGQHGTMLEAFRSARSDGALASIPGLMYRADDSADAPLHSTGIQRLVQDLDELPHPVVGFELLEPRHRRWDLSPKPLDASRVRRHTPIGSLSLSHGCKFNCDYCPIPAYNQRTFRHKSGERIADEMRRIHERFGIRYFFGTDDNFFNHRDSARQMLEAVSVATTGGKPLGEAVSWGTEATSFDTWKNRDLLPMARKAGMGAVWLGIEDMTATLVNKGQSVNQTAALFKVLNDVGISPMPMMMHHDGQPLYSRQGLYGLLNQVSFLRRCGAQTMQVTVLTPSVGTRSYEASFEERLVFDAVGGDPVLQHQFDGNNVVASSSAKPWRLQLNILAAYAWYYNPLNLARNIVQPIRRSGVGFTVIRQLMGMCGLPRTAWHAFGWAWRLWRGPIQRASQPPGPKGPVIDVSPQLEVVEESSAPLGHRNGALIPK